MSEYRTETSLRLAIVAAARAWENTPFVWQQSVRGRGCDCKGLIAGVARDMGFAESESAEARAGDYDDVVDCRRLLGGMAKLFSPAEIAGPGDVLLLVTGGKPQHLALVTEAENGVPLRMIQAYQKGPARVLELPMTGMLRPSIHSIWCWRAVMDMALLEMDHG